VLCLLAQQPPSSSSSSSQPPANVQNICWLELPVPQSLGNYGDDYHLFATYTSTDIHSNCFSYLTFHSFPPLHPGCGAKLTTSRSAANVIHFN